MTATSPSGATEYEYDANGNLRTMTRGSEVTQFSYDYDNNLIGWTPPSGTPNVFVYNSDGERIRKEDSRGVTNYLYAGGALLQELGPSGNVLTWYNPGISQKTGLQKMFFLHDRLGNTTRITDISGSPTDAIFYDAWGNIYGRTGTTDTRYTYVGKEGYYSDPDTGLIKLGARYYDPTIGRFITQDPSRDGLNWYAYAGDNPIKNVDPDGTYAVGAVLVGGVALGMTALDLYGTYTDYEDFKTRPTVGGLVLLTLDASGTAAPQAPAPGAVKVAAKSADEAVEVVVDSYGALKKAGLKDAHHVIQEAAAKGAKGYDSNAAPAIVLKGPVNEKGTPHQKTRSVQRQKGGGTYTAERLIAYKALRKAGVSEESARYAIRKADEYFGKLKDIWNTPLPIPKDRR